MLIEYHAVFGWDPLQEQIKSRDFNAQGAWFDLVHVKRDECWVIESESVYPGGVKGTGRSELTIVDADKFRADVKGVMNVDGKEVPINLKYEATRRQPRDRTEE